MKGRRFHDILPQPVADAHLRLVRQTIETRRQSDARVLAARAAPESAGSRDAPACSGVEIDGDPAVAFIARDITDRKRAEELESQNVYLQEELKAERSFGEIVGQSSAMQQVFRDIERVAQTDSTVLLLGETGTGKELIARAIHRLSRRRDAVMVKVNCGALPSSLAESELFGHERGAFTGAVQQKRGRFELANNGTIFLDEVGELSRDVQVKLLRVLQEQELERLGSTRPTKVNIRVIAATNRDLQAEVQRGDFRSDLVLSTQHLSDPHAAAARAEGRRAAAGRALRHRLRAADGQAGRSNRLAGGGSACRLRLAGQRPGARQRDGARRHPVRGRRHPGRARGRAGPRVTSRPSPTCFSRSRRWSGSTSSARSPGRAACWPVPQGAARLLGMRRSTVWSRMRKLGIQGPRD